MTRTKKAVLLKKAARTARKNNSSFDVTTAKLSSQSSEENGSQRSNRHIPESGDTVYIGVSSQQKNSMQVDAFGLVWKDNVYPDYEEAFISRIPDALSVDGITLRGFIHAMRTARPENTLIVYTSAPKVADCIRASNKSIRECRIPQIPDTAVVIRMIKERPGSVIGHFISHKKDLHYRYRATKLASHACSSAARTIPNHTPFESTTHETQLMNDQTRESSDKHSVPATTDKSRIRESNSTSINTQHTAEASSSHLFSGMHPDRLAMLQEHKSDHSSTASSSSRDMSNSMTESNISDNKRERKFGPVIISGLDCSSSIFTPNVQNTSTPSSSRSVSGMHPDYVAMLNRSEANISNIATTTSSSSDMNTNAPEIAAPSIPSSVVDTSNINTTHTLQQPIQDTMDQKVSYSSGNQVSPSLRMKASVATSIGDSNHTTMSSTSRGEKRKRRARERKTAKVQKIEESRIENEKAMFEAAIDHGLDSSDEDESQRQPIPSNITLDNVSQQPIPQETDHGLDLRDQDEPQRQSTPITTSNSSQQPVLQEADHGLYSSNQDETQQQPIATSITPDVPQQPVPQKTEPGWLSWVRKIFS
ncbi:hypothetical protein K492DRAFT_211974 [Lichtheimia hyalospora FSU 10163]|nr:hypothetical protein K492DRAFT_211974 [Lichtheimia hyalospora FSU 10163]